MSDNSSKVKKRASRTAGSIVSRGTDKWLVRIFLGRGADGKRNYQNNLIKGKKSEAQAFLTDALAKQSTGLVTRPSKELLSDFLDEWLRDVAAPDVTAHTLRGYTDLLARLKKDQLGKTPLAKVRPEQIQKFYATLTASNARHLHSPLRKALACAVTWKRIHKNPCDEVTKPKHKAREIEALSGEQAKRLMEVRSFVRREVVKDKKYEGVFENKYRPLFNFLLVTGARPSEAFGLKWTDLDFVRGTVSISRTLHWYSKAAGGGWYFGPPKTKTSRRKLRIPPNLLVLLKEHRATQAELLLKLGVRTDLVFCNSEGTPIIRRNLVKRQFKPALEAAGLPGDFTLYGLRHTCASLLLQSGVNPKVAAEFLGHSSTKEFLDTYGHLLPGMSENAAAQLEKILYA